MRIFKRKPKKVGVYFTLDRKLKITLDIYLSTNELSLTEYMRKLIKHEMEYAKDLVKWMENNQVEM